jgi:hypothetical protein
LRAFMIIVGNRIRGRCDVSPFHLSAQH